MTGSLSINNFNFPTSQSFRWFGQKKRTDWQKWGNLAWKKKPKRPLQKERMRRRLFAEPVDIFDAIVSPWALATLALWKRLCYWLSSSHDSINSYWHGKVKKEFIIFNYVSITECEHDTRVQDNTYLLLRIKGQLGDIILEFYLQRAVMSVKHSIVPTGFRYWII